MRNRLRQRERTGWVGMNADLESMGYVDLVSVSGRSDETDEITRQDSDPLPPPIAPAFRDPRERPPFLGLICSLASTAVRRNSASRE